VSRVLCGGFYFIFEKITFSRMYSTSAEECGQIDNIYRKYHSVLCFFAYKYTKLYEEAEDIVHSVFEKLLEKGIDLDNDNALKSYLFSAVHNACINHITRGNIKKKYSDYTISHESDSDDSSYLLDRIEVEILWEVFSKIEALPEECKKVFKLSYIEDMSNQEIADKLGISVNTVKSQKSRARQILKESLKDLFVLAIFILRYYR
jgi:RNA polymerase sigma-70 factor (family 1)